MKIDASEDVETMTDPFYLGRCQPGTSITLSGVVCDETRGGLLSLDITWKGKIFSGTLLDCSTSDHASQWAPPW